jgi:hypothetical protein
MANAPGITDEPGGTDCQVPHRNIDVYDSQGIFKNVVYKFPRIVLRISAKSGWLKLG